MPIFRSVVVMGLALIATTAAERAEADSQVEAIVSAIKSLFSTAELPSPAPGSRSSNAETACADALRLRAQHAGPKAIERHVDAANAGHASAAYELGMLYTQGRDVEKDFELGARWINRAADLGDPRAQYLVGANLMSGTGVNMDSSRGVAFLALAGEQGHVRAQYLLGQAYVDGVGVKPNPAWAARWYGRAARGGHPDAQYAYGVMYGSGLGLPKNDHEAYRWLVIASSREQKQAGDLAISIARALPPDSVKVLKSEPAGFVARSQARLNDVATVMFVQYALRDAGYDAGPVDGLMGKRTVAGIRAFERDIGGPAHGLITGLVLARLNERTALTG